MAQTRALRGGIVGAGRSRNGLGPFLARHLESAGVEIVGVVGRNLDRGAAAAAALAPDLGHPVAAYRSVEDALCEGLDILVIAAPVPAHLPALRAACGSGVAVLCEKPLVLADEMGALESVLDELLSAGQLLMENCQWPEALPAWRELFPGGDGARVGEVAMGLSPSAVDGMLEDSLSHLISLAQALVPLGPETLISGLRVEGMAGDGGGREYEFSLQAGAGVVRCRLELEPQEQQPRPAWLAIDGQRMDREIDLASYTVSFRAANRSISIGDPMARLVYRFVRAVEGSCDHERIRAESDSVRQRARIYQRCILGFQDC